VGGTGSNDTSHAIHLTEAATELGVDATLSVTPYYNKPSPRGIVRHYEEIAKATDKPILLYNVPSRTAVNVGPELLARLAQIEHVEGVKQANESELQMIDGLELYAGDDATFARTLDLGGAGGITVASHIVGDEMRRMIDEPKRRAEIDASLQDVYRTLFMTASPTCTKAALNMLGHKVGGLRLPLIEADEHELAEVHTMLAGHGLLERDGSVRPAARGAAASARISHL
jgi:4-hydroxy-tetrahydrodipicolinate synthase